MKAVYFQFMKGNAPALTLLSPALTRLHRNPNLFVDKLKAEAYPKALSARRYKSCPWKGGLHLTQLRESLENARFMRNDPSIMECLEARQRADAILPWSIEVEEKDNPEKKELADQLNSPRIPSQPVWVLSP